MICRYLPGLYGALITPCFFCRSLKSGILPNDVSPFIPLSEALRVPFRALFPRVNPRPDARGQGGGSVGKPDHRAGQGSHRLLA